MADKEHFIFNKYYYVYLLKNAWFSILCTIKIIVTLLVNTPTSSYSLRLILPAIVLLIASLVNSFFKRWRYKRLLKIYTKPWAKQLIAYDKYFYGAAAVILFLIAGMIK
jgi:glucose-6-phosphate-specific signal transduction histidine kinase